MSGWRPNSQWMAFERLDDGAGLSTVYTLAFKFTDWSGEHWTSRFLRYKAKDMPALAGAVAVMRAAAPPLFRALSLNNARTAIIPALSSKETKASLNGHHAILAQQIAQASGAQFLPDAISKNAHEPLHYHYSVAKRDAVMATADYQARATGADAYFVVDDFVTRGTTLAHIARALQTAEGRAVPVFGLALAKNERIAFWRDNRGVALDNAHVPAEWDGLWQQGEAAYRNR